MSREYTNKLHEMLEEGLLTHESVADAYLKYMSKDDVADMMLCNEFIDDYEQ